MAQRKSQHGQGRVGWKREIRKKENAYIREWIKCGGCWLGGLRGDHTGYSGTLSE